ncbi:uncharacterized protein BT62DRAFT_1075181 [Guyanagaster necrorhizus]|uniref:N-acetyltransferase domain-containing protein n=1 Tax=Guyanagaster necrorhizus TaxID=856835 RepID=A0A9P7VW95_9AGAR|nr:uncharacterized protein BT62DRAFT_1075181 [Guyanagaster necrorhizus MCA 3950]KAG7447865.1 hypothetical protein BT62DRAFT_1075181 [Guyanagaster necrorhizus MCA 3950]
MANSQCCAIFRRFFLLSLTVIMVDSHLPDWRPFFKSLSFSASYLLTRNQSSADGRDTHVPLTEFQLSQLLKLYKVPPNATVETTYMASNVSTDRKTCCTEANKYVFEDIWQKFPRVQETWRSVWENVTFLLAHLRNFKCHVTFTGDIDTSFAFDHDHLALFPFFTMINLSELVVDLDVEPHLDSREVLQTLTMKVMYPGSPDTQIASLVGFIISRHRCGDDFHLVLDEENEELHWLSVVLFDKFGKVKPHIICEGFRSGTRCWGTELSAGKIIYVQDVTVYQDRRQGIGSFVLQKLFESENVQNEDIVISWPVSSDVSKDIVVAFFRKNGFRRIGRTHFLGYSPNPNHPSRRLLPENDIESLEDRFLGRNPPLSPELQACGRDAIDEECRKKYPLHCAIIDQNTPEIAKVIQSFYDKDPASIHVPERRGFLPVFAAARAPNIHALNKLIEIGVAEDLKNFDNIEGVTPLEGVLSFMKLSRELSELRTGMWAGNSEMDMKVINILKTAMNLPTDSYVQFKFGCTCAQCSDGWLSPRMRFALRVQAAFYIKALSMDLGRFKGRARLDASDAMTGCGTMNYLPPGLQRPMLKSSYTGFTTVFKVIYKILRNDIQVPTLRDIKHDAALERDISFFKSEGGRVEHVLDALTAIAKKKSRLGDGTFYKTFGNDEDFLRLPEESEESGGAKMDKKDKNEEEISLK